MESAASAGGAASGTGDGALEGLFSTRFRHSPGPSRTTASGHGPALRSTEANGRFGAESDLFGEIPGEPSKNCRAAVPGVTLGSLRATSATWRRRTDLRSDRLVSGNRPSSGVVPGRCPSAPLQRYPVLPAVRGKPGPRGGGGNSGPRSGIASRFWNSPDLVVDRFRALPLNAKNRGAESRS